MSPNKQATDQIAALRSHLIKLLDWNDAHIDFDSAVEGMPAELQGKRPKGLPYSPWQLLEHIRITQRDILDFCRDPAYKQPTWPEATGPAPSGLLHPRHGLRV